MRGAVQLALDGSVATVGGRPEDDWYATPAWLTEAVLRAWTAEIGGAEANSVLDAGAGDGRLMRTASRWTWACQHTAVEIDPDRAAACEAECADFLAWAPEALAAGRRFDLVISNPPFRLWDEFVRAILPLVAPGGTALVLGFMHILGGQGRASWWRANPPSRIWLSPRRASFTGDGQTYMRDVCWLEFGPGRRNAELRWLDTERG